MTDAPKARAASGRAALLNDQLNQNLSEGLSADEKALRDMEIIEQAQKYFGGLTDNERILLGVGQAIQAEPARIEVETETTVQPGLTNEWLWAVACGLVFAGVLVWVIRGQ